jgi:DeoR/GlpR family transcriptional regulator of sugar metabolism
MASTSAGVDMTTKCAASRRRTGGAPTPVRRQRATGTGGGRGEGTDRPCCGPSAGRREHCVFYSGSTVALVAVALRQLERMNLTVVSPSLPVINEVSSWPDPHLVVVGGVFLPNYMAFVGPQAVESLRAISADVAVVGCDGMSAADGLTTPHQLVAEIGSVIVERAQRTIVVGDASKVGRRGFTSIAPTSAIHMLVTDSGADPDELRALQDRGVDVHVV